MKRWAMLAVAVAGGAAAWAQATGPAAPRLAMNDPAPTPVTVHQKGGPAAAVVKDIFEQAGVAYTLAGAGANAPERWAPVSIDAEKEPFWSVVQKLEAALPANISTGQGGVFTVSHLAPTARPVGAVSVVSGAALVSVTTVQSTVTLTDPQQPRDCTVRMTVRTEPRFRLLTYQTRVAPDAAEDENGKSLVKDSPSPNVLRGDRNAQHLVVVLLKPPADAGRTIARLKGAVRGTTFGEYTTVELTPEQLKGRPETAVAGAAVFVQPPEAPTVQAPLTLALRRNDLTDEAWVKVAALFENVDVQVTGDDGSVWDGNSQGMRQVDNNLRNATYSFALAGGARSATSPRPGGPAKVARVTLRVPLSVKDVEFPYEFKDLPLP